MECCIYVHVPPAFDDFLTFADRLGRITRSFRRRDERPTLMCRHPFGLRYCELRGWDFAAPDIEAAHYAVFLGPGDLIAESLAKERGIPIVSVHLREGELDG